MWSDAGCTYASVQYPHATAAALSAGRYVRVAPGEYIHLALGDDNVDQQPAARIDQMLQKKMPQDTGDATHFLRRLKARKQLGAHLMTARTIKDIDKEKQMSAELQPIEASWDASVNAELATPMATDPSPQHPPKIDTAPPEQPPNKTTQQGHCRNLWDHFQKPTKPKAHEKIPRTMPNRTSPPKKRKKPIPTTPEKTDNPTTYTIGDTRQRNTNKRLPRQREEVSRFIPLLLVAMTSFLLLLEPTTPLKGYRYLCTNVR